MSTLQDNYSMLALVEKDSVPSFDLGALFEHVSLRSAATKVM